MIGVEKLAAPAGADLSLALVRMLEALWSQGLFVFALSFSICLAIVIARPLHIVHTTRVGDLTSVQSVHRTPTPRIGGVAIFAAILAVIMAQGNDFTTPRAMFLLSLLPVFGAGLAEDLGFGVGPRQRLVAAIVSAAVAVGGLGLWVDRLDLPLVDAALQFWPLGVAFTLLCSSGFAHAFNLIDGVNGFSAAMGIAIAVALGLIALQAGDPGTARLSLLIVPALLGFVVFNWPFGKIFLGDAGAYSLGHVFAWLAILIAARHGEVAAFALALVLFWPVADTVYAIVRRRQSGKSPYLPDRMHFHHVTMRGLEVVLLGRSRRSIANPLSTLVMLPFAVAPVVAGVLLWDRPTAAMLAFGLFAALYVGTYSAAVRLLQQFSRRQYFRRVRAPRVRVSLGGSGAAIGKLAFKTSPLSRTVVSDGRTIDVRIERDLGGRGWRIRTSSGSTGRFERWSRRYATDQEAWDDFVRSTTRIPADRELVPAGHGTR